MPRVANPARSKHASANTPHKQTSLQSPLKIPLNDDRHEKAVRLQSRQALHDLQLNTLKAAATPVRKLNGYNRAASDSPKTPRNHASKGKENAEDGGLALVASSAMTPVKRVPILANFEEWMKMATDNKINATNSWNFALIDYFHDMSLLKEGDGVNFQKASCTLDGCVKIYTSRVDSVATETGKLLSGLADNGAKRASKNQEDGEETSADEEGGEGEDRVKKKTRRVQRSSEVTLAPSFASLQLKKFELEFSVDPLFKKASADFDEGGAKGLLLNHLAIDSMGRIVFDSSDDSGDAIAEGDNVKRESEVVEDREKGMIAESVDRDQEILVQYDVADIDVHSLQLKFFPDLAKLDEQDICPSLKSFDLGDPAGSLDIPFLKAAEDSRQETNTLVKGNLGDQTGVFLDGDNVAGFEDDDGVLGGFDVGTDAAFGDGGDAWIKTAAIEPQMRMQDIGFAECDAGQGQHGDGIAVGEFDPGSNQYAVSLNFRKNEVGHENILSYFDNALQKNWAGPEHWRIRRIKDTNRNSAPAPSRRKEKEPFEIDFASPLDPALAEMIYTPASSKSAISLPKSQWKSKTRNLLPDDKHFNSRQLLQLFLKPRARIGSRRHGHGSQRQIPLDDMPRGEVDEAFWARKENTANQGSPNEEVPRGDYNANFFQDDGLGFPGGPHDDDDDDFADAREAFSPGEDNEGGLGIQGADEVVANAEASQEGAFGTQLVTQGRRVRPEYVQYARVAKKVDVRKLKEEMWRGIGFHDTVSPETPIPVVPPEKSEELPLKFTSVMNNLQQVYPKQAMADISTSYCFICLLHLANEKGLTLCNEPGLEELSIQRDYSAEITEGKA
ncbi:hypothetical protein ACLMJK_005859 [Lecanora helva]